MRARVSEKAELANGERLRGSKGAATKPAGVSVTTIDAHVRRMYEGCARAHRSGGGEVFEALEVGGSSASPIWERTRSAACGLSAGEVRRYHPQDVEKDERGRAASGADDSVAAGDRGAGGGSGGGSVVAFIFTAEARRAVKLWKIGTQRAHSAVTRSYG